MNKILIMSYAKLGDSFVLIPSINLLREKFPNARIDFFSEKHLNNPLNAKYTLQDTNLIDNFYLFIANRNRYIKKLEKLYWLLRFKKNKYDCIFVLLPSSLPASPLTFNRFEKDIKIIGVKNYFIPSYIERKYVNNRLDVQVSAMKHLFEGVSNFLYQKFQVYNNNYIKEYLYYKKIKQIGEKNSIGICMGTDMNAKKWKLDNFYQVLKLVIEKYPDIELLFIGTTKDEKDINFLMQKLGKGKKVINLDIGNLYEKIYKECFLYLGVDTGIMHLFNLAQIPIIGLFSARDVPGKWYPYGVKNYIFREYIECEGCILKECNIENSCMDRIKVENVYQKVDEFICEIKGKKI